MNAKNRRRIVFSILLLLSGFWLMPAASADSYALLKVDIPAPGLSAIISAGGVVVQELNSCLLVRAPLRSLARIRAARVAYETLSFPNSGQSYFLVVVPPAARWSTSVAGVDIRPLEENLWLLWTADPGFRNRLQQPYRLKALALEGPFPFAAGVIPGPLASEPEKSHQLLRQASPEIAAWVEQVSTARLQADILVLQNFRTRFASTAECEAAGDFILRRFQEMGLTAVVDPFVFASAIWAKNIVAKIPGKTMPQKLVLACAHYDSTSDQPRVAAPGADDNASGTAALLELARILAKEEFDFSIGLLCVSAEEWGLYGSAHYARQARSAGMDIVAVVNLDMIAYPGPSSRILDVIGNRKSEWLADRFITAATPYVGLKLKKIINPSLNWSDHSSFWDQNYAALCGIEDSDNPFYHTTRDTLATLNLAYAGDVVKASLAVVADLAQPLSFPPVPTGLRARSQVSRSVFSSLKTVYLDWHSNADPGLRCHVYRSTQPGGPYLRLTDQPLVQNTYQDTFLLPGQAYFYALTAMDGQGRESKFSPEVRDDENN